MIIWLSNEVVYSPLVWTEAVWLHYLATEMCVLHHSEYFEREGRYKETEENKPIFEIKKRYNCVHIILGRHLHWTPFSISGQWKWLTCSSTSGSTFGYRYVWKWSHLNSGGSRGVGGRCPTHPPLFCPPLFILANQFQNPSLESHTHCQQVSVRMRLTFWEWR